MEEEIINCPKCGEVMKGVHVCRTSRQKLYKLSKDLGITGLTKALQDPITQAICKDIQDFGWVRCSTSNPLKEEKEELLLVTDGKFIWTAYWKTNNILIDKSGYFDLIDRGKCPFGRTDIVAWTYKPDLMELQECLKQTTNNH